MGCSYCDLMAEGKIPITDALPPPESRKKLQPCKSCGRDDEVTDFGLMCESCQRESKFTVSGKVLTEHIRQQDDKAKQHIAEIKAEHLRHEEVQKAMQIKHWETVRKHQVEIEKRHAVSIRKDELQRLYVMFLSKIMGDSSYTAGPLSHEEALEQAYMAQEYFNKVVN